MELRNLKLNLPNSKGIALIMVLWVITILSVVVLEFSFAMRTEVNITKNYKEELEIYAMAQGGVQRALVELVYKNDQAVQQKRRGLKIEEIPPEMREWMTDGRLYSLPFDQGVSEIRIMSEGGKININTASNILLQKVIGNLGLQGEARDIVVDSILDWIDPDDFYRTNGAENDYYQSLKEPYYCKNGPLSSIEELLLIRGVTPDLFYGKKGIKKEESKKEEIKKEEIKKEEIKKEEGIGGTDRVGLKDLFSIYAIGEQVDINSASPVILRFGLGLTEEVTRAVVKAREEKGFVSGQDLQLRVPELTPLWGDIGKYIVLQSMIPYYTIESKAKSKEGGTVRGLKVIVKIDPTAKRGFKIIQWVDVRI